MTAPQLAVFASRAFGVPLFDLAAFDWNCSQHITPRFTLEQLREAGVGILGE